MSVVWGWVSELYVNVGQASELLETIDAHSRYALPHNYHLMTFTMDLPFAIELHTLASIIYIIYEVCNLNFFHHYLLKRQVD